MSMTVNTNVGALAALQSLNATNKGLATVQNRINTGMNVSSTKDDSASFTIAQTLRGDMGALKAVSSSLSRAKSVTDVAVAGAEQISDLVNQMKAKAYEAADAGIDAVAAAHHGGGVVGAAEGIAGHRDRSAPAPLRLHAVAVREIAIGGEGRRGRAKQQRGSECHADAGVAQVQRTM